MDKLLARLERHLGRFAIPNLTAVIVGGMVIVFVLGMLKPHFLPALELDIEAVRRGQVWRLVTYLFLPTTTSVLFFVFAAYFMWTIGNALEAEWGAFKLNAYYFVGMLGTTAAALITRESVGNIYLNTSLFLAGATVFPNFELLLFFVLPVRLKWLGWLSGALLVWQAVAGGWPERAAIFAAMSNYLLFFSGHLAIRARGHHPYVRRQDSVRPPAPSRGEMGARVCAICGAREEDDADIRVCSCEKCGGVPRTLCLEHARNH